MAKTLYDKIFEDHVVERQDDGTCLLYIDRHLVHEVTSPQAFEGLRMTGRKVRAPEKTLAVVDHNVPTSDRTKGIDDDDSRIQVETLATNARDFGVEYYNELDKRQGIVHVVGPEQGFTLPGTTIVCGDSHTSTHGAFGALAHGIGTSEVEHVLATQTLLAKKAKNMLVQVDGQLPAGVTAKDIVLAIIGKILFSDTVTRDRVENREFDLLIVCPEIDKEVVDLVEDLLRSRIRPIDLVDDHNRREPPFERLAQHESRLRQRSFRRIDEQHHAVDHRKRPFDLAAKIGVPRRIDDVDKDVAIMDGRILRHDGDPALALEVVTVHGALGHALIRPKRSALMQERIDQRGLAMVDVGNDGDIPAGRIGDRHLPSIAARGSGVWDSGFRTRGSGSDSDPIRGSDWVWG